MSKIKLTWSLNAGSAEASIGDAGTIEADAVTKASVSVAEAGQAALDLEHADLANLVLLVVRSSDYSGDVTVTGAGAGATEVALTGPLVLYGGAIGLLGDSLATLTVANNNAQTPVDVDLLIGRALSDPP